MPVAVRPIFRVGEATTSVNARGAFQRGISSAAFARRVGYQSYRGTSSVANLEEALGYPAGSIAEWACQPSGSARMTFRGVTFHSTSGVPKRPRVCLACLADDRADVSLERDSDMRPFMRSIWSVCHLTVCPVHFESLIDTCVCGEAVDQHRAPFDVCTAGHRLQGAHRKVGGAELAASLFISAKLEGASPSGHPVLQTMNWHEAGLLLCNLGGFSLRGRQPLGLHGSIGVAEMTTMTGLGWEMMEGLPGSFERLLDQLSLVSVRTSNTSTTIDGRGGMYGVRLIHWLRSTPLPSIALFRDAVDARERQRRSGGFTQPNVEAGIARGRAFCEVPDARLPSRIQAIPGEAPADRAARARAVWQQPLTADEAARLNGSGLSITTAASRFDALAACRNGGVILTLFGVGALIGVRPYAVASIVDSGALRLAWPDQGTQRLCLRSDAEALRTRLFDLASLPDPEVEYMRFGCLRGRTRIGVAIAAALSGMPIVRALDVTRVDELLVARETALAMLPRIWRAKPEGYSCAEFANRFKLGGHVVSHILAEGLVPADQVGAHKMIATEAAEAFAENFISLRAAADAVAMNSVALLNRILAHDVHPVVARRDGKIFERRSVAPIMARIRAEAAVRRRKGRSIASGMVAVDDDRARGMATAGETVPVETPLPRAADRTCAIGGSI